MKGMQLKNIVSRIEQFSPPSLAQSWDNVGLLVEPKVPMNISKIILTNDLTEDVMKECVDKNANMIVSYHPPIFRPLKKLTSSSWKVIQFIRIKRIVLKLNLLNGQISIF